MIEIQNNQMKVRISCDKRKLNTVIHCQFVEDTETCKMIKSGKTSKEKDNLQIIIHR